MGETDRTRTFRVVILDSRQHPYSPGIVGLDTFEVERWSMEAGNEPQVKWSDDRSTERPFFNGCFLGVCCGSNAVRIYARAIDGWWTHATTVYSQSVLLTSSSLSPCVATTSSLLTPCLVEWAPFLRSPGLLRPTIHLG
jgi:hypothetical protein